MTAPESASRLLLHLLTLRGIDAPDVDAAIRAGYLTERDWCLTLELMRGWEEGKAEAQRLARWRTNGRRYRAERGAA